MNRRRTSLRWLAIPLVLLAAAPAAGEVPAQPFDPWVDLARHAPAVVSVRYLAEVRAPGVDREVDNTVRCLVIDTDGWILCSNTELGGYFSTLARLMGRSSAPITIRPKDLRVRVDGRELTASLVARDSDRDLAWLLLDELPADLELTALEIGREAAGEAPKPGEPLYLLRRLDEYFGEAPAVVEARVAAVTQRPRSLIVPSPSFGHVGMPVFDAAGRLVGLTIVQVPGDEDSNVVMNDRQRALPGQSGPVDEMVAIILPVAELRKATELAREIRSADQADSAE